MHEAAHRSLFGSRRAERLRRAAGSARTRSGATSTPTARTTSSTTRRPAPRRIPDLALVTPFPITRASLRRKVWRDLSGQTGVKFARAAWARSVARAASEPEGAARVRSASLVTNALAARRARRARARRALPALGGRLAHDQHARHAHPRRSPSTRSRPTPTIRSATRARRSPRWWERLLDRAEPRQLPPRAPPADDGAALPPAARCTALLRERGAARRAPASRPAATRPSCATRPASRRPEGAELSASVLQRPR